MDPRYPAGLFSPDQHPTAEKRAKWIAEIETLPGELDRLASHLTPAALATPYRDGGWTARQVIHHLADSHLNAYTRLRLALTEDCPTIKTYQEQLWAELPDARDTDIAPSLAILRGLHARWALLLRSLNAEQFARTLNHPEWGTVTVDYLLQTYAWHSRHHLAHVARVREMRDARTRTPSATSVH